MHLSQYPAWAQEDAGAVQLVSPVVNEQEGEPAVEVNPASHAVQDDAPPEAYVFAAQIPVTAVRPDVAQYEPPSHEVHALKPVAGW